MSKEPMKPGQAFHLPAAQEKNLGTLMELLKKKEVTAALTAIGKTDASTWIDINSSVTTLKDFIDLGGASIVVGDIKEHVKQTIIDQVGLALAPITNEIDTLITDALAPILLKVTDIANELANFISGNVTGALIGAMAGGVASLFVAGGPIWIAIGAIVGAALEEWLSSSIDPPSSGAWDVSSYEYYNWYYGQAPWLRGALSLPTWTPTPDPWDPMDEMGGSW